MASPSIRVQMFLMVALGIGCILAIVVLNDIRIYLNLQRRLREERRRREEKKR